MSQVCWVSHVAAAIVVVVVVVVVVVHCDGLIDAGGGGKLVTLMLAAEAANEAAEAASEAAGGIELPLLPVPPMVRAAWAAVDLLTHFSMWPFKTSRLLNFLPQRGQG